MHELLLAPPGHVPPLQPAFRPAISGWRRFREAVEKSGAGVPVRVALCRSGGQISTEELHVFDAEHQLAGANLDLVDRWLKFLLWQRGAERIVYGGPRQLGEALAKRFSQAGARRFDAEFFRRIAGGSEFEFAIGALDEVPDTREQGVAIGRHLDGCRIGFDLGASDRKTSAVIDGEDVFSEEVPWDPKSASDWRYHYEGIRHSIQRAAEHLPRIDAIGGSAAGVYVNNEVRAASLFRSVPESDFQEFVRPIFRRLGEEFGAPLVVVNDGAVTALAGSMSLDANRVLGIAMGSSEAAGYVDRDGRIPGWLDELAFAPIDFDPGGPVDEWSGDRGCGVQTFSQQGVMRLAAAGRSRVRTEPLGPRTAGRRPAVDARGTRWGRRDLRLHRRVAGVLRGVVRRVLRTGEVAGPGAGDDGTRRGTHVETGAGRAEG